MGNAGWCPASVRRHTLNDCDDYFSDMAVSWRLSASPALRPLHTPVRPKIKHEISYRGDHVQCEWPRSVAREGAFL